MLLVIGGVFSYLKPNIGVPVLIILGLVGLYLLLSAYNNKLRVKITLKKGGKVNMLVFGVSLIVIGIIGVILVIKQLEFKAEQQTKTNPQTPNTPSANTPVPFHLPTFVDESKIKPEQPVSISIGTNLAITTWDSLKTGFTLEPFMNGFDITVWKEYGRVLVDVVVSDNNSTPIKITHNSIKVDYQKWDYNHDDYAFEVVNENNNPIFQIIYKTQFDLIINGIFPQPDKSVVWVNNNYVIYGPSAFEVYNLNPIFKYPSEDNYGIRVSK